MKPQRILLVLAAVAILSAAASAQDNPQREGLRNRPGIRPQQEGMGPEIAAAMAQRMPVMMAIDTNQDGILSATEIENAPKTLLKLDKDGDGVLSREELRPDFSAMAREGMARFGQPGQGGPPTGEMLTRMFDTRDTNKDGKLTGDEIPERMRENLARVDENGDGAIEKSEMERAVTRMAQQFGRQRGVQGENDGSGVRPRRPPAEE